MEVSALYSYPLKSGMGLSCKQARLLSRGLENDRRWMVVDEKGLFVTARQLPALLHIQAIPIEGGIRLQAPGQEDLRITYPDQSFDGQIKIWKERVSAMDAGNDAADWLNVYLGNTYRLVYTGEEFHRQLKTPSAQAGDQLYFPDRGPVLIIAEASLESLNTRLDFQADIRRFRPNIVVSGCEAFVEDHWQRIKIGKTELEFAAHCARCILTTIDPETLEFHSQREPFRTLNKTRASKRGCLFGSLYIPRKTGNINLDDPVQVLA